MIYIILIYLNIFFNLAVALHHSGYHIQYSIIFYLSGFAMLASLQRSFLAWWLLCFFKHLTKQSHPFCKRRRSEWTGEVAAKPDDAPTEPCRGKGMVRSSEGFSRTNTIHRPTKSTNPNIVLLCSSSSRTVPHHLPNSTNDWLACVCFAWFATLINMSLSIM